ncbi:MAG: methyltransferase domain-containing protein, partial [Myxococcota bacterium]
WRPGAFSMIHDHGHTQWGAVQVFGAAEHACFRLDEEGNLVTAVRTPLEPGQIVYVPNALVHQMGNPTDAPFFSLHVYGTPHDIEVVTGDARMFDVHRAEVQRTGGGVFFALPRAEIDAIEPGPSGDYATVLRYRVEAVKRLHWMAEAGVTRGADDLAELTVALSSVEQKTCLHEALRAITDDDGHITDSVQWDVLNQELRATSALQRALREASDTGDDDFADYAQDYDALIGQPCLDGFMKGYLARYAQQQPLGDLDIVSVGCGTALVEEHLIRHHGADPARLYGFDLSDAMVEVARRRIQADQADLFEIGALGRTWDLAYAGLNVLQYATPERFEDAVAEVAKVVRPGGGFLGDFITPDHIRRYPNLLASDTGDVLSLRTPRLRERDGSMLQESDILNISFTRGRMAVEHVGRHARFLPPIVRVRRAFEQAFGGPVELVDAVTHQVVPDTWDTCPSTRYVVHARKVSA